MNAHSGEKEALIEALEALQRELHKIEFYGQAAEDNLERLEGTFRRCQRADAGRLDHAIQCSRTLVKQSIRALETAIRSMIDDEQAAT
jgi:hypothetical protein